MNSRRSPSIWKQIGLMSLFLLSLFEDRFVSAKAQSIEKISISPTPQEEYLYGKGFYLDQHMYLTAGRNVSKENIAEFKKILQKHIAEHAENNPKSNAKDRVSAILITTWDYSAVKRELKKIGIPFTKQLPPEGYLLATGQDATGNRRIVLVGSDQNGLYYAEQTLSQILSNRRKAYVPGIVIRDWPGIKYRGVIEGFYGQPWNQQDRLRIIAFCAYHKMNMYVYAPKDDVYHRNSWKMPYPPRKLKELQQVIRFAEKNHIKFVFSISPGPSICYSNKRDLRYIMDKSQIMWNSGVRDFAILFDDISRHLKYPQDRAFFGTSSGSLASAQAYLQETWFQNFCIKMHR